MYFFFFGVVDFVEGVGFFVNLFGYDFGDGCGECGFVVVDMFDGFDVDVLFVYWFICFWIFVNGFWLWRCCIFKRGYDVGVIVC